VVYYRKKAYEDLNNIFDGLIFWEKHLLELEHVQQYVRDIEDICNTLDSKDYHQKSIYNSHRKYGDYVYRYKRNQKTIWYIIYNRDLFDNIYIERIMSNYMTIL
jgi:hypothetical protein